MAAGNLFNSFTEAVAEKKHDLGSDTLEIALCAAANAPTATDSVLTDLTQIAYTYLTADRTLTVTGSAQTSGTYKLTITDKVITATGGTAATFRYIVIFNQTASNDELILWYDYGSDVTLNDGEQITINFDDSNGVLTIAAA